MSKENSRPVRLPLLQLLSSSSGQGVEKKFLTELHQERGCLSKSSHFTFHFKGLNLKILPSEGSTTNSQSRLTRNIL